MVKFEDYPASAEEKARQTLDRMAYALTEAIVAVEPGNSAASPLEIFPEPGERRADTEFELPAEQENAFREAMAKLGIGRETNFGASQADLSPGYIAVIEGGQGHKILAELNMVLADEVKPSRIIVSATPDRQIKPAEEDKAKEREITARILGITPEEVGDTEFKVAAQVVKTKDFISGTAYNFGLSYETDGKLVTAQGEEGRLTNIGTVENIPVDMLSINREYQPDGKYKVLGARGIMSFIGQAARFFRHDGSIAFVTSATYQPSREVDAASVMLEAERAGNAADIRVLTYGTAELAAVKGEHPSQPALGQLAGEAHKAAVQIGVLRQLLEQAEQ